MTYQVLARKWRPKDFASLVGQEHVVRALTHALDGGRLHHAYLFTGTRGVGKTTLSRIFAKALNCETGVTSQPCGVCRACREIDEGRFVDYVEMDAASNRGVDEMAALLERAVYAPVDARFKVYMIDEVHMLTNHAFNAMLKTLEEPPSHVKFILATTDPQKIPVTVLSRCLQFNLKQMPAGHIVSHLERILGEEQISFEQQALRLLARAAQGSMRDALSLTDQAIAYSANEVTESAVSGMLGASPSPCNGGRHDQALRLHARQRDDCALRELRRGPGASPRAREPRRFDGDAGGARRARPVGPAEGGDRTAGRIA
ncbi:DNA polymerase III, subunit gamma and tau [Burkholderia cepacia GG4]|uniref:DNA polymerase III subunit gamma/tau n=1 Tax=Burkholderia cepacia GG4 TaxID=1009846 RepID=A0A9W3K3G3_BURCE|nr:DNA polymerase III, subunit gamma and tau [Burkholderia cepacia GG4]